MIGIQMVYIWGCQCKGGGKLGEGREKEKLQCFTKRSW